MPSIKMIRRRMNSVATTTKIMKAMNMVAASKLQKDKARLEAAQPFLREAQGMILRVREQPAVNPFFEQRKAKRSAYLVITGDRGLCGSYNANLVQAALEHMDGKNEAIVTVGLKGYDYLRRHGKSVLRRFDDVLETAFYEDAQRIAAYLATLYESNQVDEVYVSYTKYKSALVHEPQVERLLPLCPEKDTDQVGEMRYDTGLSHFLDHAIPIYLSAFVYAALLESSACEQAARMVSMDTAVNNAGEITESLTRAYNRRRQGAITQEISELVASTNILEE